MRTTMVRGAMVVLVGAICLVAPSVQALATVSSQPAANPYAGPVGTAFMHGDSESSDTSPYAGPGTGVVTSRFTLLGADCPTILEGSDGLVQALCTTVTTETPTVYLIDPRTGQPLAQLALVKGALLGGVYAYLDNRNRLVVADGGTSIVRVSHQRGGPNGAWTLSITSSTSVTAAVDRGCGSPGCDAITSLNPDFEGRVWFSTNDGTVGYFDPRTGIARSVVLGKGEHIDNSLSSSPAGVAVTTTYALYLLHVDARGDIATTWRRAYDRGPARKPGQLSWGSGSTPTFFGPHQGTDYLTITDNASPQEHLLVFDTHTGALVCRIGVLGRTNSGTENAPIGADDSVYIGGTYGYPYPATPSDSGPAVPAQADFTGGLSRVDVNPDGRGCHLVWTVPVRSASVPRLSSTTHQITLIARANPLGGEATSELDTFAYTVVDARTGAVLRSQVVGIGPLFDTLEQVGTIDADHVYYQGTLFGLLRISG